MGIRDNPLYFTEDSSQIWGAAMRQYNPVLALRDYLQSLTIEDDEDPDYDAALDPQVEARPELRWRAMHSKSSSQTARIAEQLDEEKFVTEFTKAVIKGWKGLKLEHLETLLLIDMTGKSGDEELEYSLENAETLVSSSTEFDTWLNEVVFDLDNFRTGPKGPVLRKAGAVLPE